MYIPRQFRKRFNAIRNEDYRLRKLEAIKHKTRIEYSEDDLVLYSCPVGHYRFTLNVLQGLPTVDLAPVRTPPPGRKSKRNRSDSASPNAAGKKKERVESAPVHDQISADAANQVSFSGADQVSDAGVGQTVVNNSQDQEGGIFSKN